MTQSYPLGVANRLVPGAMTPDELSTERARMDNAHTLIRRYETAIKDILKPFGKLCKDEIKKLRAVQDECNDITSRPFLDRKVQCEVVLYVDPDNSANDCIAVVRTDPDHEGEIIEKKPLTAEQRAEIERGVLPGFENEPRIESRFVPQLTEDPRIDQWERDNEERQAVHSRVFDESAKQINGVLVHMEEVYKRYQPADDEEEEEPQPKKRGRPRKNGGAKAQQMSFATTPLTPPSTASTTPAVTSDEPTPVPAMTNAWDGLSEPTTSTETTEEDGDSLEEDAPNSTQDDDAEVVSATRGINIGNCTEEEVYGYVPTDEDLADAHATSVDPPQPDLTAETLIIAPMLVTMSLTDAAPTPVLPTVVVEPTPIVHVEEEQKHPAAEVTPTTEHEQRVSRLLEGGEAAKKISRERGAKKTTAKEVQATAAAVVETTAIDTADDEKAIAAANISDSFLNAMKSFAEKRIVAGGDDGVTTIEIQDAFKAKMTTKPKEAEERAPVFGPLLRVAVAKDQALSASGVKCERIEKNGVEAWKMK